MLGTKEGYQLKFRGVMENVNGGAKIPVNTGGIGNEADFLPFQEQIMILAEHFQTGSDFLALNLMGRKTEEKNER